MRLSHIGWNLAGLSLPLLVAAATVPGLIERLGNERFGLLALAWGLIGYAGALDLGIGRALTQMVSRLRGEGDLSRVPAVLATASRVTLISGIVGGCLIALLAAFVDKGWITVDETTFDEISLAMLLMALALPAQAISATYRGLSEAYQNFKGINVVRIALGVITFGGPYLVSSLTHNLAALVATLVASRLAALVAYRALAQQCVTDSGPCVATYCPALARSLFSFGSWVTVSSVASPILVQADRFVIGAIISASAVTGYVLPYELVVQSLIVVGAISSAAFPTLTKLISESPQDYPAYFRRWLTRVVALMLATSLALAALLPYILEIWIKDNLDPISITVGQILCIGVFANSIGTMFYALLHARGRADLTAKLHLAELPVFLIALFVLTDAYGVVGAAWAWVGRMTIDAAMLGILSRQRDPGSDRTVLPRHASPLHRGSQVQK